jgi:hypothetical protein
VEPFPEPFPECKQAEGRDADRLARNTAVAKKRFFERDGPNSRREIDSTTDNDCSFSGRRTPTTILSPCRRFQKMRSVTVPMVCCTWSQPC